MAEFDLVAPVYDETRRAASEPELDAIAEALGRAKGYRDVLEVGVGTGRCAGPLQARGFRITGVDLSREMLRRARAKEVGRLVQGDLHHLPFGDGRFDSGLAVHVFQLIPEPRAALRELARVSRARVVAELPNYRDGTVSMRGRLRERYAELAAEMGHPLPKRRRFWENSEKVLRELPPDEVREVREDITPHPDPERRWRDLRTFGGLIVVPPEVHERIVAQLRKERPPEEPPRTGRFRTLRIASWEAGKLRERLARDSAATAMAAAAGASEAPPGPGHEPA